MADAKLVAEIAEAVEKAGGYDLQQTDQGAEIVPGWEGLPTRRWTYRKGEGSQARTAEATMLNPSPEQMARWIVAGAEVSGAKDVTGLAKRAVAEAVGAGGFHFVVWGFHLEGSSSDPTRYINYPFFDGVTVKLKTIPKGWSSWQLTDGELAAGRMARRSDIDVVGKYGRLLSITRQEYKAHIGPDDTIGAKWVDRIGALYRAAWGQDSNPLVTAPILARRAEWRF
jgi:hypothetical protein